MGEFLGRL